MTITHLAEEQVQQYAENDLSADIIVNGHLQTCGSCRSRVANYQALFKGLLAMEQPVFDFDLSAAVLKKLPVQKPSFEWPTFLIILLGIFCVSVPLIIFQENIIHFFKGLSSFLIYLVAPATICMLIFQATEYINSYKRKTKTLDFY